MMNVAQEMPVYLFTGFLDAGKTTFIQDALESEEFGEGEQTLLLVCEEGEVEYEPERFYTDGGESIHIERIEEESDLSPFLLNSLAKECRASRVIVEWNGMWRLSSLYENAPRSWVIYQQLMLADAGTFLMYNRNIRQQTFEQMQGAELIAFNRCRRDDSFDDWKMEVHRICRVANRKAQIIYEFGPNDVMPDDIEDPLPYDMTKQRLDIGDDIFAEWYRDINEKQDDYEGKEITIKGRAVVGEELPQGKFIFGRHVMTCCEEDIQFAGLLCRFDEAGADDEADGAGLTGADDAPAGAGLTGADDEADGAGRLVRSSSDLENGEWVEIRARIRNEYDPVYGETGPVLYCSCVRRVKPCDPEVATF